MYDDNIYMVSLMKALYKINERWTKIVHMIDQRTENVRLLIGFKV